VHPIPYISETTTHLNNEWLFLYIPHYSEEVLIKFQDCLLYTVLPEISCLKLLLTVLEHVFEVGFWKANVLSVFI